ncbi:MAG: DUF4007 family protein [Spirochaetales bacterium]|jgi:hypothetical protein|nr:DUF4007 family protein [Spirochaetales bacterium]
MKLKFKAHQSFFIRNGWLYKGMTQLDKTKDESGVSYLFQDQNEAVLRLGIGVNMASSLRYWLQAVGLVEQSSTNRSGLTFTEFGKFVYQYDRHFQSIGTLLLCHYQLSTNIEFASTWYYFFNEFRQREFSKQDLVMGVSDWIFTINSDTKVAPSSIESDVDCLLRTYIYTKEVDDKFEDNKVSPFVSLNLIARSVKSKNQYYKRTLDIQKIPPSISMFIILRQIEERKYGGTTVDLNDLLHKPKSIGKVLNLQVEQLISIIDYLEALGFVRIVRTAGLEQLFITSEIKSSKNYLEHYFKGLDQYE